MSKRPKGKSNFLLVGFSFLFDEAEISISPKNRHNNVHITNVSSNMNIPNHGSVNDAHTKPTQSKNMPTIIITT